MRGSSRSGRRRAPGEHPIVRECRSFLDGDYAEHLVGAGRAVPAWAWLNSLAHGSLEDLRSLASGGPVRAPGFDATAVWRQALAYLAQEVLFLVDGGQDLAGLQRTTLVPLELALAREPARTDPGQLVWMVLDALAHPRTSRR